MSGWVMCQMFNYSLPVFCWWIW